jgi:hypothetical protein
VFLLLFPLAHPVVIIWKDIPSEDFQTLFQTYQPLIIFIVKPIGISPIIFV